MIEARLDMYIKQPLQALMQQVSDDYYNILLKISAQVEAYAGARIGTEEAENAHLHLNKTWATGLKEYVQHRRDIFLPYLQELAEKEDTGHNCSQCSGRCDMQHTSRMIEFTYRLEKVKALHIAFLEQSAVLGDNNGNDQHAALYTTMQFLNEYAQQLWRIETDCIIPRIKMAQKNINAHS